jgi:CrcB protein
VRLGGGRVDRPGAGEARGVSLGVWIGIALLGGAGAVARDVLERRVGLLVVNVAGSAALGALAGVTGDVRALAGVGFLGSFTSFSGWAARPRLEGFAALALGLAACALARAVF